MPSPLRNPKTLAEWFELDYFRRRRLFRGLARPLTWGALVVSCLAVGWTFLAGKQSIYQAGPLTTAHALFNNDCGKCHTEAFPGWNRLWTSDAAVRAVPDSACKQCHAGPLHHECAAQRNCAGCHHEHRGAKALAHVTDNHCTSCHADLQCDNGKPTLFAAHVTAFADGEHPEFGRWRQGKPAGGGTSRFRHKTHLEPLPTSDRKSMEQLTCRSCHAMDEAGRFMRPINYDRDCKRCHLLSVQLVGDWKDDLNERAAVFRAEPAPHPSPGKTAEMVRAALRERLTSFILKPGNKAFLTGTEPDKLARPLPGWPQAEAVPPREFAWVNHQLHQVERMLFDGAGGCRHCHDEETEPARRPDGLPVYRRPRFVGVDNPWYEHSVFSHLNHQALECGSCHPPVTSADKGIDVEMPGIGTCLQCHNARQPAGARSDCVECHVYHNPQDKRQFQGRLTIDAFRGK